MILITVAKRDDMHERHHILAYMNSFRYLNWNESSFGIVYNF